MQSFSREYGHFLLCCRFHPLLKTLESTKDSKTSDDAQICILRSMFEIYKSHQQVHSVVFFVKIRVVLFLHIALWFISVLQLICLNVHCVQLT